MIMECIFGSAVSDECQESNTTDDASQPWTTNAQTSTESNRADRIAFSANETSGRYKASAL